MEKAREFQKNIYFCFILTMPKPLTVWITINCGKFWKKWEYQTTWPASWETCMQVKKQQLELDMEQWTFEQCSKLGKEYKAVLSPCLFNFYAGCITQNARLDESQAGIKIAERNQQPQIGRLLLFGPSVTSHTLGPHGLQHTRLPCPALSRTLLKLLSI